MARVCCGTDTPHVHMCYLGPLGAVIFELVLPLLRRRWAF